MHEWGQVHTSSKWPGRSSLIFLVLRSQILRVVSLLLLISIRLSLDQQTWYTGPTWPLNDAINFPLWPSQSLTELSNEALAIRRPSGEKLTWLTSFWWPVSRANGFLFASGSQKNIVKSSEPDTRRSGCFPLAALYRSKAICLPTWQTTRQVWINNYKGFAMN